MNQLRGRVAKTNVEREGLGGGGEGCDLQVRGVVMGVETLLEKHIK